MKTLKKKIEILFAKEFHGHPSREDEHDIEQIKKAILMIAQRIDEIDQFAKFE